MLHTSTFNTNRSEYLFSRSLSCRYYNTGKCDVTRVVNSFRGWSARLATAVYNCAKRIRDCRNVPYVAHPRELVTRLRFWYAHSILLFYLVASNERVMS